MCIIVAKEKNVKLPTKEQLLNCFDYNDDGAGFMYIHKGKVVIDKGYMTWDKFYKRYRKLCRKFNNFEGQSLIMHFRIGTSSGNTPQNTHPYPVSNNINDLHKLYIKTDLGVVHNGIIHDYTPTDKNSNTNDTQEFVLKYISTLYQHYPKFYKNKYIMDGIADITDSKLAFMDNTGYIYYVGDFINDEGLKFSNNTYELYYPMSYNYGYNYGYNYYDSYDDLENHTTSNKKEELMALESKWIVEYNGKWEEVGDRNLLWDINNGTLYELIGGKRELIDDYAIVYDENYEYVY